MDLNSAIHSCRCGAYVRDDANMKPDWKVVFVPKDPKQAERQPLDREGLFYYVNPQGEVAHKIIFTDAMRSSFQWRTVL